MNGRCYTGGENAARVHSKRDLSSWLRCARLNLSADSRQFGPYSVRNQTLGKGPVVPRFFTLVEAEAMLPEVERTLRSIIGFKSEHDQAEIELNRISQKIHMSGGMMPPRDKILSLKTRKQAAAESLKRSVEQLQSTGCQLKDVEVGLLDFPTLYRGKEVYLCWHLGETGINFWHHVEDGYRGRRAIDSEFLSNHRGDSSH
jgi:hypothetical protein